MRGTLFGDISPFELNIGHNPLEKSSVIENFLDNLVNWEYVASKL